MIKINPNYLHLFKKFSNCYNYMVAPGVWLTFDTPDLDYIGVNYFYLPHNMKELEGRANDTLNRLIADSILEVID